LNSSSGEQIVEKAAVFTGIAKRIDYIEMNLLDDADKPLP
jgi:hypothetical protein